MRLPVLLGLLALTGSQAPPVLALPPIPETPAAIVRLVAARPFVADEPLGFSWDRSQPPSRRGWLLVVQADPGLVATRQLAEPNLLAGDHVAMRAGRASSGGIALYLLPADVDLGAEPLFFAEPALPESLSEDAVRLHADGAREAGLRPPSSDDVAAALAAGGSEISIATFADLAAAKEDLRARFLTPATSPSGSER